MTLVRKLSIGTRFAARRVAPLIVGLLLAAAPTRAQQPSSTNIELLIRQATDRYAQAQKPTPDSPTGDPQASEGPTLSLTLDEAVKMALDRNLDITVQRLNPQTFDLAMASARAVYLPTITSLIGNQRQLTTPASLLSGGQLVPTTTTSTLNAQLIDNVRWGGGSLDVVWNNNRVATNSIFYNYNPSYNSFLTAQYTQPLLRGFHTDAARQQLAVTKVNRAISDLQLQSTITNTLTAVRDAYWDLVYAVESIEVAKTALDTAQQLVDENQKRVQAGAMTRLDLLTATSQEATDRHSLVLAEANRRTSELALKRLIVAGPDDALWHSTIEPADRPDDKPRAIDLEGAIRKALSSRTDLAQAKEQTTANDATLKFLREQTRPQMDLVGTYGLAGLGGTKLLRAGGDFPSSITGPIIGTIPGAYGDSLSSLLSNNYPTWGVSLNVAYPIGYSTARAETARAELQVSQVVAQTRQLEVQVVTDVTNAAIQVRNSFDEIETAQQARDLAVQKLDAEQKKFAVGMSTNFLVVQAQKDLTDARSAVLQAEITYQKSLVDFDRAQQTTMQAAGVTVVSPNGLIVPAIGSGRLASPAPSGAFVP